MPPTHFSASDRPIWLQRRRRHHRGQAFEPGGFHCEADYWTWIVASPDDQMASGIHIGSELLLGIQPVRFRSLAYTEGLWDMRRYLTGGFNPTNGTWSECKNDDGDSCESLLVRHCRYGNVYTYMRDFLEFRWDLTANKWCSRFCKAPSFLIKLIFIIYGRISGWHIWRPQ